jgi:outer membrane protein insertion porin family
MREKSFFKNILCAFFLIAFFPFLLLSQEKQLIVNSILINGTNKISKSVITKQFETQISPSGFSQFMYSLGLGLGSPKEYFSKNIFDSDISNILKIYKENGFYETVVDTSFSINEQLGYVDIKIDINEGYQSLIDSVIFLNINNLEPKIQNEIINRTILIKNTPFYINNIKTEINRILYILSNNGYPNSYIESNAIVAGKLLSTKNYIITFPITTGEKCYFGETKISIESDKHYFISSKVINRQVEFKEGEAYSSDKRITSERNINRLGIFDFARLEQKTALLVDSQIYIPINILLKPRNRFELAPEIFLNDEDNFNIGAGISGTIRNIGGAAQNLIGKITGQAQSFSQGSIDLSLQFLQPYFIINKLTLNVSSTFGIDFRKEYKQNIFQAKAAINSNFYKYNFFQAGVFSWELERAEVSFSIDTLITSLSYTSLELLEEPQFNSIFGITLQRDQTNDIFSPTNGDYMSLSLEESGFVPSKLIKNRDKLRYSQFVKYTIYGRYFKPILENNSVLGFKLKFGQAIQYGVDQDKFPIPLNRRFFAGGSNSLRGWTTRGLGHVFNPELGTQVPEFGGNVIIEGTIEARIRASKSQGNLGFIEANKFWLILFTDFGNIWNDIKEVSLKYVAISSGLGIRYDLFFGPIRVDMGLKTYDPYGESNRKWIIKKKFFSQVLGKAQVLFGIGHAF